MANVTPIGVVAVVRNLSGFNQGMMTMRRQMGITGSNAVRMGASFTSMGHTIRNVGNQVLILGFQLTFLAAGPMAAVITAASRFESEMVKIITLVGVAEETVSQWSDSLLDLAPELGKGPSELAEALFFITSAGVRDQAEAIDVLINSAKGASIGLGETKVVANAVTSAMQAYADEGLTAARATDILTATVREGKGEASALAPTLGRVIPIAQQMGVSFEEVGAFIGTFTRLGVPAQVAVTSLRAALTSILKPTQKSKDALEKYGLTIRDVRGAIETEGFAKTMIALTTMFGDSDEAMGQLIGSVRGLSGVLGVTGGLADDYLVILDSIKNSAGITAEGFERFGETTEFQMNRAKASLEVLAVTIGTILLPGVNALLDGLSKLVLRVKDFASAHPDLVKVAGAFLAVVTALGPLLIISGLLISSLGTFLTLIGSIGGALALITSPIGAVVAALLGLAAVFLFVFGASFKKVMQKLDITGSELSQRAFAWGRNIVIQLARGMASAIASVIRVLIFIGTQIARLLRGRSPPALLPDLREWGANAMNQFLEGWLEADFSIFNDLAGTLESFIRSLDIGETNVVPTILKVRDAIKSILDTLRTGGGANIKETIQSIANTIGASTKLIEAYVVSMVELAQATEAVTEAQENLNEITRRYSEQLRPLEDELREIESIREQFVRDSRRQELEFILQDPRATDDVIMLAELELRELDVKDQVAALEDQRDAELSVAEAALETAKEQQRLAQERVNIIEAQIKLQTEQNNLLKEQEGILDKLKEAAEKAAGAGDDLASGLGGGLGELEDIIDGLGDGLGDFGAADAAARMAEGLTSPLTDAINQMGTLMDEIVGEFAGIPALFEELTDLWSDIFVELIEDDIPAAIVAWNTLSAELERVNEETNLGNLIQGFKDMWDSVNNNDDLLAVLTTVTIPALLTSFGGLEGAIGSITAAILGMSGPFAQLIPTSDELKSGLETLAINGFTFVSGVISAIFGPALRIVWGFITGFFLPILIGVKDFLNIDLHGALAFVSTILTTLFGTAIMLATVLAEGFNTSLGEIATTIKTALINTIGELIVLVSGAFTVTLGTFRLLVLEPLLRTFGNIVGAIQSVINKIGELKNTLASLVIPDILKESSPSPMERTLRNSAKAMNELTHTSIPDLTSGMANIDRSAMKRTMADVPVVPGGNTRVNVATVNMGGQMISSGMDEVRFRAMVEQIVAEMI